MSEPIRVDSHAAQTNRPGAKPQQPKSLAIIHSRTIVGVDAVAVTVEVHLANGLPMFSTVGLPETAVKESKDRVRGAILNSGFDFPAKRITVNLAPADIPKTGGRFDLPIALGILAASGQLGNINLQGIEAVGELALNGNIRPIKGVLPTALASHKSGRSLLLPDGNKHEAALAETNNCYSASHLLEVCSHLRQQDLLNTCDLLANDQRAQVSYPELTDVKGQERAKRALKIAAVGGHSLLLIGPPGTGKSMLAARLPGLLPELSNDEAIQSAAIYSVANGDFNPASWRQRPFRSPHHSASAVALVGGGSFPRPGEISLAHKGTLFLDELTEFSRAALEQLREPLETGKVNIARASQSVQYPADFQLITACNPCPCGFLGDGTNRCACGAAKIESYKSKLSGPLLDRIDIHLHLPRVSIETLQRPELDGETSAQVRRLSTRLRAMQIERQGCLNNQLNSRDLSATGFLHQAELDFLAQACERLRMSGRAYHRILKVARTIADVEASELINRQHLSEALSYRALDRV